MGAGKAPSTTQKTTVELSPEQKQLFGQAFPYAQQYASHPLQQYSGSGIAPLSPLEQQARVQTVNQAAPAVGQLASEAKSSQDMMLDPNFMLDVANNPYLNAANTAMTSKVTQNLQEQVLPSLRGGETGTGGMYSGGNSKAGIAEGLAVGRTNAGLADAITNQNLAAYTGGRQGMQQAIAQNPGVQAQQLVEPSIIGGVGAQDRALSQAQLDEQIQRFYAGQELPFLQAQELMSLVTGMPGGTTVSNATGSIPQPSPVMQGLGILSLLLGGH